MCIFVLKQIKHTDIIFNDLFIKSVSLRSYLFTYILTYLRTLVSPYIQLCFKNNHLFLFISEK